MHLVAPKVVAKHEVLFNKPASERRANKLKSIKAHLHKRCGGSDSTPGRDGPKFFIKSNDII